MSIEKFNPTIRGELVPYLQVNRNVVQSIRDPEVLAVWVYLLSLPPDWEVIKNHLQTHFKIGERKLKAIFSSLRQHKLINYIQHRNEDGKMGKHEIVVLNGSEFTELFTKITAGAETARAVNRTGGNADLHIKQNTYQTENKKSFCDKDEKKELKSVDKPKKKDWKEANQQKHSWADKAKEPPRADVTRQSTSYDPAKHTDTPRFDPNAPGYQAFLNANPAIKRAHERRKKNASQANELPTGTAVQSEIPSRSEPNVQGATIDVEGGKDNPPPVRGSNRLLEARRVHSFLEETGMACAN